MCKSIFFSLILPLINKEKFHYFSSDLKKVLFGCSDFSDKNLNLFFIIQFPVDDTLYDRPDILIAEFGIEFIRICAVG